MTRQKTVKPKRTRLAPSEREAQILSRSIRFFAEHGFDANLRDLGDALGIAPSLVNRYFGTKDKLISKVYERVFLSRWNVQWVTILRDRERPLKDRLEDFYTGYLTAVDDYDWMRIAVISGLQGDAIIRRYFERVVIDLIQTISEELRDGYGDRHPDLDIGDFRELAWSLHAAFIYLLMRRYVFQIEAATDNIRFTRTIIAGFFTGIEGRSGPAGPPRAR